MQPRGAGALLISSSIPIQIYPFLHPTAAAVKRGAQRQLEEREKRRGGENAAKMRAAEPDSKLQFSRIFWRSL